MLPYISLIAKIVRFIYCQLLSGGLRLSLLWGLSMGAIMKRINKIVGKNKSFSLAIKQQSEYDNIYYCCTQKTASQWFKKVFSDPIFFKYTGLKVIPYSQLPPRLQDAKFDQAFPIRTLVSNLYIDYISYQTIPKPKKYKTFFILRDPRDIVVSWYFSVKNSHPENYLISQYRIELNKMTLQEGLKYSIEKLESAGLFYAQKSWMNINEKTIKIFRYEDFTNDNYSFLNKVFNYLDIKISETELKNFSNKNKFEHFSGNRNPGTEDLSHHYRKGVAGDWLNYFDNTITDFFKKMTGDLLEITGYSK
jgi:hypothetical protein